MKRYNSPIARPFERACSWGFVVASKLGKRFGTGLAGLVVVLAFTGCLAPLDDEDELDERTEQTSFALGTGEKSSKNGEEATEDSNSGRETNTSGGQSAVTPGEVEEPDPVPWKGSGSGQGSGQDNGD